jgi:hypothetical protein
MTTVEFRLYFPSCCCCLDVLALTAIFRVTMTIAGSVKAGASSEWTRRRESLFDCKSHLDDSLVLLCAQDLFDHHILVNIRGSSWGHGTGYSRDGRNGYFSCSHPHTS